MHTMPALPTVPTNAPNTPKTLADHFDALGRMFRVRATSPDIEFVAMVIDVKQSYGNIRYCVRAIGVACPASRIPVWVESTRCTPTTLEEIEKNWTDLERIGVNVRAQRNLARV